MVFIPYYEGFFYLSSKGHLSFVLGDKVAFYSFSLSSFTSYLCAVRNFQLGTSVITAGSLIWGGFALYIIQRPNAKRFPIVVESLKSTIIAIPVLERDAIAQQYPYLQTE